MVGGALTYEELNESVNTFALISVQQVDSINVVKVANVFFNRLSTICLVRNSFTNAAGLVGISCKQIFITT